MRFCILTTMILFLNACSSTNPPPKDNAFTRVSLQELLENKKKYDGKRVSLEAYIVGSEYNPSEDDAQFFILSLGDQPPKKKSNNIFCPKTKYKVRAAEDGYNKEVIIDCYRMANAAKRINQKITIFGVYKPDQEFYYYKKGIDLRISKIRIGNKTVNSDFADKSKIAHDTPGMIKTFYKGGKKIYDLAKKLTIGL
jgi:hypothetical protein